MIGLFSFLVRDSYAQQDSIPFWNYRLSFEKRASDIVSRLTLEEKVAQMLNAAPAIPRLGIPAYDWWNEVLHGVARTPYRVTVYPQAIAMAATWDTNSLQRMADYSALEGRAVHNKAVAANRPGDRYVGLTYWTPNINIFRDPRWGRGQETYGEDPFLTGSLGAAFVRGLQGNDPKYLKAAACAKHFAVHSGPEPSRHVDNFTPTAYDLWDTYLPAFEKLVTRAGVAGVMCAYNAIDGQPCCGNDQLMNDILRRRWKFTGYVTSDCWALDDFFRFHKTHPNATAAAVDALIHGTDVECGVSVYKTLVNAVREGLVKEEQIDLSLRRLFLIRLRLGLFDPASMVSYARTPDSVLENQAHRAHALKMARQSIVLLKNQNNLLPLSKKLRKIAVVGPNADNAVAVLGNYNGIPSRIVTALDGLREKLGSGTEIVYEKAINFTNDTILSYMPVEQQYSYEGKPGIRAEYFDNRELKGEPLVQMESSLDHFWQEGQQVAGTIHAADFSARYTTWYKADATGSISFEVDGDDGYRLLVNDKEQINTWTRNRNGAQTFQLNTVRDSSYKLVVEYYQAQGKASIRLRAGRIGKTDFTALANRLQDADAIIFVGGISPQLEGEEMRVNFPGFNGGDRTSIALPAVQTALMKSLQATGKPVVLVLMTGSAIAIPWENEHLPAIVNAWYGGQSAGTAIADVLFGDYNPAGRLPVTFYQSDNDLPSFSDYSMNNRTYRYFTGKPLYGFGFGLSYTSFHYDQLTLPAVAKPGNAITVTARVTNTGKKDGEEVIQLYLQYPREAGQAPLKALKGFQRVMLRSGESKIVRFRIRPEDLSVVYAGGKSWQPGGTFKIFVGGSQPDEPNPRTSDGVSGRVTVR